MGVRTTLPQESQDSQSSETESTILSEVFKRSRFQAYRQGSHGVRGTTFVALPGQMSAYISLYM